MKHLTDYDMHTKWMKSFDERQRPYPTSKILEQSRQAESPDLAANHISGSAEA